MDWIPMFIQAVAGALGGNIGGQLNRPPQQESSGTVMNTILGVIAGVGAGHFGGAAVGEVLNNATGGQAAIAGAAGFLLPFVINIVRRRKPISL